MSKFFTASFLILISCSENKSPCILQANYDSGLTSSFNFRKDGTFEWTNGSGLGVFSNKGRYALKDSIITLDRIGFDKVVKSIHLLITAIQPVPRKNGKYVIQDDEHNKLIDNNIIFTVYVD